MLQAYLITFPEPNQVMSELCSETLPAHGLAYGLDPRAFYHSFPFREHMPYCHVYILLPMCSAILSRLYSFYPPCSLSDLVIDASSRFPILQCGSALKKLLPELSYCHSSQGSMGSISARADQLFQVGSAAPMWDVGVGCPFRM